MKYPHTAISPEINTRIVKRMTHPIGQQQNAKLQPILARIRAPTKKKIHLVQSGTNVDVVAATNGSDANARNARIASLGLFIVGESE
jgi:hypothetical protein